MFYPKCDVCNGNIYPYYDPFVKGCKRDDDAFVCIAWGHWSCINATDEAYSPRLPRLNSTRYVNEGCATPGDLDRWIDSPDAKAHGYDLLT